jgi:hypothetical protein
MKNSATGLSAPVLVTPFLKLQVENIKLILIEERPVFNSTLIYFFAYFLI